MVTAKRRSGEGGHIRFHIEVKFFFWGTSYKYKTLKGLCLSSPPLRWYLVFYASPPSGVSDSLGIAK